ncbi:MAG TPA: acyl-CoA reductase [Puia sp.]|nr:acyl-CoA reductase [Puia sp.]
MNVDQRIDLLAELGAYCLSAEPAWLAAQRRAHAANGWFTPEFIGLSVHAIATRFLQKDALRAWAGKYGPPDEPARPVTVGLTMAGNIPLVGFHDFLSIFISGHRQLIRPSGKDEILIRHLVEYLCKLDPAAGGRVAFAEILKGCGAYVATGSNNSARYFEYYFSKYPHIIRRNRTSVAVLTGEESRQDLDRLADDVYQYLGLGCRNVTQLYVPENYDFLSLLQAFRKYNYLAQLSKYKHNYDYQLTLLILNKKTYMSNESILLTENSSPFSPISVLHYAYYRPGDVLPPVLSGGHPDIQCIVGRDSSASASGLSGIPSLVRFGQSQRPALDDYADGVDTMKFLSALG